MCWKSTTAAFTRWRPCSTCCSERPRHASVLTDLQGDRAHQPLSRWATSAPAKAWCCHSENTQAEGFLNAAGKSARRGRAGDRALKRQPAGAAPGPHWQAVRLHIDLNADATIPPAFTWAFSFRDRTRHKLFAITTVEFIDTRHTASACVLQIVIFDAGKQSGRAELSKLP